MNRDEFTIYAINHDASQCLRLCATILTSSRPMHDASSRRAHLRLHHYCVTPCVAWPIVLRVRTHITSYNAVYIDFLFLFVLLEHHRTHWCPYHFTGQYKKWAHLIAFHQRYNMCNSFDLAGPARLYKKYNQLCGLLQFRNDTRWFVDLFL